jgi:lysophospholipase L1-like esterase
MAKGIIKLLILGVVLIVAAEATSCFILNAYTHHSRKVKSDVRLVQYWEFDPYLMWIPKKNVAGYDKYSNYKMNNYGFRNSYDIEKEKGRDVFRIMVLGGSTSWGSGASSNDSVWTKVIEDILRKKLTGKVEVLNAGCAGYTSFQESLYLQFKLLQFAPDLVIVMDGYNDLFMAALYTEEGYEPNASVQYDAEKRFFNESIMAQALGLVANKSHLISLLRRIAEKVRYERGQSLYGKGHLHDKGIRSYLENINTIESILNGRNIKSLFLLQPYMGISKKHRSKEEEAMLLKNIQANDYMVTLMEKLRTEYGRFAIDNKLNYHDLSGIYDDVTESETVWFDHIHLNDNGHRILAEKVGAILEDKGLLR